MLRKRVYLIVIVMIILMGTGCSKSKYLNQINLGLPDEMEYLSNFFCGEKKEIYVVGTDSQKELKIWSKEDGQEWKEVINLYELIHYDKEKEFCQVFWGKQGEIFCERVSLNSTSQIAEIYFYEIIDTNITRTWSLELECFEDGDINVIDEVYQISDDILVERELGGKCYSIEEIGIKELRNIIAFVPQETYLFQGTINENLLMGIDYVDMEWMDRVLEGCSINELIKKMPYGLDTIVGEKGYSLSSGERQRIAIARAMLKKPIILLMDESTSNLDIITEKKIYDFISISCKHTTCIYINHRIESLNKCDEFIEIINGKIKIYEKYKDLNKNCD